MKKENLPYILVILGAVIIIIALALIGLKQNGSDENGEETPEEEINYSSHESYDKKFMMSAPDSWKEVTDKKSLNENANIELNDEDKSAYVVVVITDKKNTTDDFEDYKKRVFQQKEQYYKTKVTSYEKTQIAGHDAEYAKIYYTDPNQINIYIRAYAVETDNYFGQIVIWTLASNEKEVQEEFDKIAGSFREVAIKEDNE